MIATVTQTAIAQPDSRDGFNLPIFGCLRFALEGHKLLSFQVAVRAPNVVLVAWPVHALAAVTRPLIQWFAALQLGSLDFLIVVTLGPVALRAAYHPTLAAEGFVATYALPDGYFIVTAHYSLYLPFCE